MNHLILIENRFPFVALMVVCLTVLLHSCKTTSGTTSPENTAVSITKTSYLQKRNELVMADKRLSFSAGVILSEEEKQLDLILSQLQREKIEIYKAEHFFPPARNFYQSKTHIESDHIFTILSEMPKGGALHIHTMAMGDADWIINRAIDEPLMHVYWGTETEKYTKGQFRAFQIGKAPTGFIPAKEILDEQTDNRSMLRSLITFDEDIDRDSVDIWMRFDKVFQRIIGFVRYEPIFADYIAHGLEIMAEDHVQHVELRMSFADQLYHPNHMDRAVSIDSFVDAMNDALRRVRKIDPEFTIRIIHANLRFRDNEVIWNDMQKVFEHRINHPNLLSGYDLVAEEDAGHTTLFHLESFLKLDSLEKAQNTTLPLYLHDGESDWAHSDNLYDAILLGTKRIGHGFNLFRFPGLMKRAIENDICIEINPLSNQILGYIRDLRMHPAHQYIDQGINCTISSDDPLIFDYHGLSYDYWNIYMAWELSLADLKKLSQNGIQYSALSAPEKAKALKVWKSRWNTFVTKTLEELN